MRTAYPPPGLIYDPNMLDEQELRICEIMYLGSREKDMTLWTAEEKELLARAASLMDELLETLEVIKDHKRVEDLRVALREVEEGKARPLDELVREWNLEGEV